MTQHHDPNSSQPAHDTAAPPAKRKKRHPVRLVLRILLLAMAIAMMIIVVVEQPKRSAAIDSFEAIQNAGDLSEEELNDLIIGEPETTTKDGATIYTWPGVIQDYHVRASISNGRVDRVDRYSTGPLATAAKKLGLN